jgi:hypothetical protein
MIPAETVVRDAVRNWFLSMNGCRLFSSGVADRRRRSFRVLVVLVVDICWCKEFCGRNLAVGENAAVMGVPASEMRCKRLMDFIM